MKFKRTEYGTLTVLQPQGEMNADSLDAFRAETDDCLTHGDANLILDCAALTAFDSAGLEGLLELRRRCREKGGALRLCGLDAVGRKIFEITRLQNQFDLFDDVEVAIRSAT